MEAGTVERSHLNLKAEGRQAHWWWDSMSLVTQKTQPHGHTSSNKPLLLIPPKPPANGDQISKCPCLTKPLQEGSQGGVALIPPLAEVGGWGTVLKQPHQCCSHQHSRRARKPNLGRVLSVSVPIYYIIVINSWSDYLGLIRWWKKEQVIFRYVDIIKIMIYSADSGGLEAFSLSSPPFFTKIKHSGIFNSPGWWVSPCLCGDTIWDSFLESNLTTHTESFNNYRLQPVILSQESIWGNSKSTGKGFRKCVSLVWDTMTKVRIILSV